MRSLFKRSSALIISVFLLFNPYYGCMLPAPYEYKKENAEISKENSKKQPVEVKALKKRRAKLLPEYKKLKSKLAVLRKRIKEHNLIAKTVNTRDIVAVNAYNHKAKMLNDQRKKIEGSIAKIKSDIDSIDQLIEELEKEISPDGRYVKYPSGVVHDTKTGLEWVAGPDVDITWYKAKSWAARLTVKNGGWRMPTIAELKTLYQSGAGTRNMTEFLETTGWWVWSGQSSGLATAWLFYFRFRDGDWYGINCTTSEGIRAFAVRSRK